MWLVVLGCMYVRNVVRWNSVLCRVSCGNLRKNHESQGLKRNIWSKRIVTFVIHTIDMHSISDYDKSLSKLFKFRVVLTSQPTLKSVMMPKTWWGGWSVVQKFASVRMESKTLKTTLGNWSLCLNDHLHPLRFDNVKECLFFSPTFLW